MIPANPLKKKYMTFRRMRNVLSEVDRIYESLANLENLPFEIADRINEGSIRLPCVLPIGETLSRLSSGECSLCRLGDGEFRVALGESIEFQESSPVLAQRLKEILRIESEDILVGIPDVFGSLERYTEPVREFWREHLVAKRAAIYDLLDFGKEYQNTLITRPYNAYRDKLLATEHFQALKQLWQEKTVLVIEGANTRMGRGNDLLDGAESIERIICPARDAFARYPEVLEMAEDYSRDKLTLIALGPTATVLAHDLALEGRRALDIGHMDIEYEWFLRGAMTKTPIPGKHVNEARAPGDLNRVADELLESQVVARIM